MSAPKASNTERGYGHAHQRLRKWWTPIVARGGVTCTRFGHPLFPECPGPISAGQPWHLGHHDFDRAVYTGPEHASCNVRASNLKRDGLLILSEVRTAAEW